jgi:hypothetical protein
MACAPKRPALRDGGEDDAAASGAGDDGAERAAGDDGEADGARAAEGALAAQGRNQRGLRSARPRRQGS